MVQRLDCRIIKLLCRHCAAFSFCREVVKLAATRLIALHKNKGKSVAACLKSRTDYAQNPDKTQQGELVSSYECSPLTVDEEFMLSKRQYELMTGRRQKSDVIAYQIRQSFKPGEITAEEANKVGYELAMRFTKGKYAFIVATHTDRKHIHNHMALVYPIAGCIREFFRFGFIDGGNFIYQAAKAVLYSLLLNSATFFIAIWICFSLRNSAKAIAVTAVTTFVLSLYLGFGMMLKFPVAFLPTYQIREAVTSTAIFQPFPILIGIVWVVTLLILSWCSFRKCELK